MLVRNDNSAGSKEQQGGKLRLTSQPLLPQYLDPNDKNSTEYELYPFQRLGEKRIFNGYESLANWITDQGCVVIDGFSGVLWNDLRSGLSRHLDSKGIRVSWIDVSEAMKSAHDIEQLVAPFLGEPGSLWGRRCTLTLNDFFDQVKLKSIAPDTSKQSIATLTIYYGTGASLIKSAEAPVIYIDIPKNEIQYRMRAGSLTNLGADGPKRSAEMYKRFYFVDWVVLGVHKKSLLPKAAVFADAQWINNINWMFSDSLHDGLKTMSHSDFRVRPWFEAGAWGGQWMKERFKNLNKDEVN
ncbi:MAG: hypothetical protein EOO04_21040, partial [Chitinophagaceae bacterium]